MRPTLWILSLGALALAACGGKKDAEGTAAGGDQRPMAGMDSMQMGGMQQGTQMMAAMQAHMDSMQQMSPEQMRATMAAHDGRMSRMLDAMGAEMRSMNMVGDSAWTALTDSVKRDLAELPGLQGQELTARMRAHAERVRRLIQVHEGMMKAM